MLFVLVEGGLVILTPIERGLSPESVANSTVFGLLGIGLGPLAVFGSRGVRNVLWDLALFVVGVTGYVYVGGFLWQLGPVG